VLVTGGFEGYEESPESSTDWHVVAGFLATGWPDGADRIETLLPDPKHDQRNIRRFHRGAVTTLHGRGSQARRFATVDYVDAFATVNADNATQQMVELALALGKPVLPLPFTGDVEEGFWKPDANPGAFAKAFSLSARHVQRLRGIRLGHASPERTASMVVSLLCRALRRRCFVIMKYGGSNDVVYRRAIVPALTATGYLPLRADEVAHVGDAVAGLREAIHASDLVVALLDKASLNVAYEIGFAHALGKPVVLASLNPSRPENRPFDLRNWQVCSARGGDTDVLRGELVRFIRSVRSDSSGREWTNTHSSLDGSILKKAPRRSRNRVT